MTNLYKVSPGGELDKIERQSLTREEMLERWIEQDISLIGLSDHFILGRQVVTDARGRIDILAIDRSGDLTVIELKRDKTSREIVAQALDYASWVVGLTAPEVDRICQSKLGKSLDQAFKERFGEPPPEVINANHTIMLVASELDPSSRRIVEYLAQTHGVGINTVFFSVFGVGGEQFLATDWLMDQAEVEERTEARKRLPWSGAWYANVGEGPSRSWDDMRRYGFIAAGGGKAYSGKLHQLSAGDTVYMYFKGAGYVGRGTVTQSAVMAKDFKVGDKPLLGLPLVQPGLSKNQDDAELSEYVVGMDWQKTIPSSEAKTFQGAFANQNVVCKLRDPKTLEFLRSEFG